MQKHRCLAVAITTLACLVLSMPAEAESYGFRAYYTKIDSGEPWEQYSLTGKYADVVVKFNDEQQFVFHRASSYLPYWQTENGKWYVEEIVPRRGDGPPGRPDKNNIYSFVRIIESTADHAVVHWRYFPDFVLGNHSQPIGGNVGFDGVVHEYFTIRADGRVTRTVREGAPKLDDWNDPRNRTIQELKLTSNGISQQSLARAGLSKAGVEKVPGAAVKTDVPEPPVVWWKFDDALTARDYEQRDLARESVSGHSCAVAGHKSVWKKGVSGTALAFDGCYSKVSLPEEETPDGSEGFTVEAWVAPGAYSICSWTAIAHQSEWEAVVEDLDFDGINWGSTQMGEKLKSGFFIGIDERGHLGFQIKLRAGVQQLMTTEILDLYGWTHVAASYGEGRISIYVNGAMSDFRTVAGEFETADKDFVIGMNDESIGYVSQHVVRRFSTFPSSLGFDGLIDEVRLYDEALGQTAIAELYESFKPADRRADLEPRVLPGETGTAAAFGAYYTNLKYHDLWDNMWRECDHPDMVVKFDEMPTSVIFWRGNRNPGWVTETNKWVCDQSSELTDWHWDDVTQGCQSCCEHMSDYEARHSHVRLIENTDARVVVQWRYASVDVLYKHPNVCRNPEGWGVWTDEYITIYPDGLGVRKVDSHGARDFYSGRPLPVGFHDTQILSQPGTKPEDNIYPQSLTIVSHKDKVTELDWTDEHPGGRYNAQIAWINFRSDYKVFEVFPPGTTMNVWAGDEKTSYSKYSAWNHYPVTQAPCDGRFCQAPDRLTHSALGAADNLVETGSVLIYGFTNDRAASLVPLARSWNHAPPLSETKGCDSHGYDKGQRAYLLSANAASLSFTLDGSEQSPVVNPCFVIKNWGSRTAGASLTIDGIEQKQGPDCRQGVIIDTDGTPTMVIWLDIESTEPTTFEISRG